MRPCPAYSVVIPTHRAGGSLEKTLDSFRSQTVPPSVVFVVDATAGGEAAEWCGRPGPVRVEHVRHTAPPSAAHQRNSGASLVNTPLIAFFDDDMVLPPDTMERLCAVWTRHPETGGVAARISGMEHLPPGRVLRAYYRWQAGYEHPHYGGRLFGPAINCLPAYGEEKSELIPAMWLNSGCVVYRTDLFKRELFPDFEGYAFMEDVHLSSRIARTHTLYFHGGVQVIHADGGSGRRIDRRLARMMWRNRRRVAREVLGIRGVELEAKLFFHRLFNTCILIRSRKPGWMAELAGTWCPW